MSSINPLQTTLQNLYNQIGANVPASKAGMIDHNALHNLGLNANLLQNLRNDLSAVAEGSNPERALNNLMSGLQQLSDSTNGRAKEWFSDKPLPEGGKYLVKGENGEPQEITPVKEKLAGSEPSAGGKFFVKGENGEPQEITSAKEKLAGSEPSAGGKFFVKGENGEPQEITPAKEKPAGSEPSAGGKFLVKGENGEPQEITPVKEKLAGSEPSAAGNFFVKGENGELKEITPAKEKPAGSEPSAGGKFLVKGENGEPQEIIPTKEKLAGSEPSAGGKFFVKGESGEFKEISLAAKADNVISPLKKLLDANATGTDIAQAVAALSPALQGLTGAMGNDPEKLKAALLNSIRSLS